jgi:hypothetical protein
MPTKPPPLTSIAGNPPARPLGTYGTALWNQVMSEYRIDDIGGRQMLTEACAELDRAESLAEIIAREGEMITTRFTKKIHPAVKAELDCRAFVCRVLERLGLNVEVIKPVGRPPSGGIGWKPDIA